MPVVVSTFSPMRRLVTVATAVVLAQAPVPPPGPAPAATAMLGGRVLDATTNRPVANAIVTLTARLPPGTSTPTVAAPGGDGRQRVLTDGEGRFAFRALRAGVFDVIVDKRGYVSGAFGKLRPDGSSTWITLADSEARADLPVRLWKHASIAGSILDEAGEPVVGVTVYALRRETGVAQFNNVGTSVTDDRGMFRIGSLIAGDYIVGVPSSLTTMPDAPQSAAFQAQLPRSPAGVDATRVGNLVFHGAAWMPVTPQPDESGTLNVYQTAYYPVPPASESPATIRLAFGESASVPPIRIRPVAAVRVSGTLTNVPPNTAWLQLVLVPDQAGALATEFGFETARAVADASGAFTFLGVPAGTYRLRGSSLPVESPPVRTADGGVAAPTTTNAPLYWLSEPVAVGNRDVSLSVMLRPPLKISGRLVFEGSAAPPRADQPLRGVVSLAAADGRQTVAGLTGRDASSAGHAFSIVDVAGGSYVLRALSVPAPWSLKSMTWRGQDIIDAPIDLSEDAADVVVTFTDRPTTLSGRVTLLSGAPDIEALVLVFPVNPARWTNAGRIPIRSRSTRATSTGAFMLSGLPPGDYYVAAVHDGAASNWLTRQFLERLSSQAVRIRLDDGATVTQNLRRVEIK